MPLYCRDKLLLTVAVGFCATAQIVQLKYLTVNFWSGRGLFMHLPGTAAAAATGSASASAAAWLDENYSQWLKAGRSN